MKVGFKGLVPTVKDGLLGWSSFNASQPIAAVPLSHGDLSVGADIWCLLCEILMGCQGKCRDKIMWRFDALSFDISRSYHVE